MSEGSCDRCERAYPVWFAPSDVWNRVIRLPDGSDQFPFLCPLCFMMLAEQRGYVTTGWIVAPDVDGGLYPINRAEQVLLLPDPRPADDDWRRLNYLGAR